MAMKRMVVVGFVICLALACSCCEWGERSEKIKQTSYFPYMAITESGEELLIGFVFASTDPNDLVTTVILERGNKNYYYDLRK